MLNLLWKKSQSSAKWCFPGSFSPALKHSCQGGLHWTVFEKKCFHQSN